MKLFVVGVAIGDAPTHNTDSTAFVQDIYVETSFYADGSIREAEISFKVGAIQYRQWPNISVKTLYIPHSLHWCVRVKRLATSS